MIRIANRDTHSRLGTGFPLPGAAPRKRGRGRYRIEGRDGAAGSPKKGGVRDVLGCWLERLGERSSGGRD